MFQPKPGMMQCHAKVVCRTLRIEVWPERVEELLAMQTMTRFESQEFDDRRGPTLPPDRRWHDLRVNFRLKPAKQAYLKYWIRAHGDSPVPRVSLPCDFYSAATEDLRSFFSTCRACSQLREITAPVEVPLVATSFAASLIALG
jgi:hypothetical protein